MIKLCDVADVVEGSAKSFMVENTDIVVVNDYGQFKAFLNWCPHLGIELNFMPDQFLDPDGRFIVCANHGALFELEQGDCVAGPCAGQGLVNIALTQKEDELYIEEVPETPMV